jgi:hypothetical protein
MSGFCEGYINNCDCSRCKHEDDIRAEARKAAAGALLKRLPCTQIFSITKIPLGGVFFCSHCTETYQAYFVIDKPSESVYLCATHFGAELYRTMKAYNINTMDGNKASPPV